MLNAAFEKVSFFLKIILLAAIDVPIEQEISIGID